MARRTANIFPGLAAQMAFRYHDIRMLASILGISYYSVRRRLNGEIEFELGEIKTLMNEYEASFETLFGKDHRENINKSPKEVV
jgi:hypothetical protein